MASACQYQSPAAATAAINPSMRPRSFNAVQRRSSHAAHAMGARIINAGILTRNASAAQTVPAAQAVLERVSRYTTQASTAATE